MSPLRVPAALALVLLVPLTMAADCGSALNPSTRQLAQNEHYTVAFAPQGPAIAVGRHFNLEIVVCPRDQTDMPSALKVDADMPAHQHGMNYRASVKPLAAGRYRAEGLMFHMPGRWRFVFDLALAGQTSRLTREIDVE